MVTKWDPKTPNKDQGLRALRDKNSTQTSNRAEKLRCLFVPVCRPFHSTMAAAAYPPYTYQPLLDHDGVIDETFRFLLVVAHGIDYYIKLGKRKGCNDYAQGSIYRQSSNVIAHRMFQDLSSTTIDCYTKLLPYTQDLRERAQVFDVFSNTEYEHHPFHWHKSTILGVEAQLRFYLNETYMLCKTLNETTDEEPEDQMEQLYLYC